MNVFDAARNGKLKHVKSLIEQGADKNNCDSHGYTPLYLASWYGHLDVVQYLVEQGASLDKASNHGTTPLIAVAIGGHLEVARYLLEQGADRDKANNDGYTPLHLAAQEGNLEIGMLLMSYGADLNARTNAGSLPIDVASTEEMKQAIRDEPRRRMDHGHKRVTEQDRHPNTSAPAGQQEVEQNNKRQRLAESVAEEGKVAEEDEDSEPSDVEED